MSNIHIFYSVIQNPEMELQDHVIEQLPSSMATEIKQYKKQDDRVRLTVGKLLLQKMVNDLGYQPSLFTRYSVDLNGKPFIPDFLPFNITHSGQVVACAVLRDVGLIGIDVEMIRPIEVTKFNKQFSPPEMMQIMAAPLPNEKFFEFWTMKEAVMKADGRGMRIPLHSIRLKTNHATIDDSDSMWHLWPLTLHESVKSHVCSNLPGLSLSIHQIDVADLLKPVL